MKNPACQGRRQKTFSLFPCRRHVFSRLLALALVAGLTGAAAAQTAAPVKPADPAAASVRGAPIETGDFRYQRRLPEGPAQLVALPLDAGVLAHSQGPLRNFADVRIVDEQNLQIPYVLEQRAARLTVEVSFRKVVPKLRELTGRGRHCPHLLPGHAAVREPAAAGPDAGDLGADLPAIDRARCPASGRPASSDRLVRVVRTDVVAARESGNDAAAARDSVSAVARPRAVADRGGGGQPAAADQRGSAAAPRMAAAVLPAGEPDPAGLRPARISPSHATTWPCWRRRR